MSSPHIKIDKLRVRVRGGGLDAAEVRRIAQEAARQLVESSEIGHESGSLERATVRLPARTLRTGDRGSK